MDDFTYMFLGSNDNDDNDEHEPQLKEPATPVSASHSTASGRTAPPTSDARSERSRSYHEPVSEPPTPTKAEPEPKKRRGFRDFLSRANLQDQLLDKLFQQVLPSENFGDDLTDGGGSGARDNGRDYDGEGGGGGERMDAAGMPASAAPKKERPGFSVAIMSNNFRRFNARIGVVFRFQKRVERLLGWRHASHTLAALGVYTFVCLNPYLLTLAPAAVLLIGVLVPGFIARHPGTSSTASPDDIFSSYAKGPPLAPPRTVKPVKELSRDFFRNMGDLQNSMEDFSVAHDQIVQLVVPATNFSDEAASSALFVALCAAAALLSVAAHLLPWRLLCLVAGWLAVGSAHPAVARALARIWPAVAAAAADLLTLYGLNGLGLGQAPRPTMEAPGGSSSSGQQLVPAASLGALWAAWVSADIILDEAPEVREVEIFELQRRSPAAAAEWEPWVFSPNPFDPLSQPRLASRGHVQQQQQQHSHRRHHSHSGVSGGSYNYGNNNAYAAGGAGAGISTGISPEPLPTGARFFEDVLPPPGWEWSEKKWALDLWSRDWVEERIITGVEVETEGERWVYDMYNEHEQQVAAAAATAHGTGLGDSDFDTENTGLHPPPSKGGVGGGGSVRSRWQLGPSWEEGEADDGMGRRGEWRRRRWVRLVKRKKILAEA